MSEDCSIETSNTVFFLLLGSLLLPWMFMPDGWDLAAGAVVFALWGCFGGWRTRRAYLESKRWVASLDDDALVELSENRREPPHRLLARAELRRRRNAR